MTAISFVRSRRLVTALLLGTALGGVAYAQDASLPAPPTGAAPSPSAPHGVIRSVAVTGSQRLEPDTVRSYVKLTPGGPLSGEVIDAAIKDLYATDLFADVQIRDNEGALTIIVRENPVVNRIVLEGNKRLKEDKILPEIKLAPRQIFTRTAVRADVTRIIELYRRQGRFAASVEPKMVRLDQNRVDVVYEIHEGDKSKVRRINIIGNEKFSAGRLRAEMATKESGITKIFSSGTSYDPDRLAYDQQKLRQFYLTNGYADFRVVSAVAELTPNRRDFIITYVVEEGDRYKVGDVKVESDIRDFKPASFQYLVKIAPGQWYNAKAVEDTVDTLTEAAGQRGYAFADIHPEFDRNKDKLTMGITFKVADAPRVYVERVDINGNTSTRDKVIRREFRLAEGDAFNGFQVKRSRDRIQSLGFFQDKLEIEKKQGSTPDRVILSTNVEEKATGQLQVSAGYSSLEKFIVSLSITQSNFMGKGQEVRASVDYSTYSKSLSLGFTEPYLFDHNIAVGGDIFRRDYNSFNTQLSGNRRTTYQQTTTGGQLRFGVPLNEFWSAALRYGLSYDHITLDKSNFYTTDPTTGKSSCNPVLAGRYLCEAVGNRLTSSVGYSLVFDNLNDRIRPTRGQRFVFSQDFAGLGGEVRYIRTNFQGDKYRSLGSGFVLNAHLEGGYIKGIGQQVRLTDRYFLGEPQIRGFDIRGVGPRVLREPLTVNTDAAGNVTYGPDTVPRKNFTDDALGGNAYYLGHLQLELPLGSGGKELGLRPSIFVDAGAVFGLRRPDTSPLTAPLSIARVDGKGRQIYVVPTTDAAGMAVPHGGAATVCATGYSSKASKPCVGSVANVVATPTTINPFQQEFLGDSPRPRVSVGFGVNWNSPFGPLEIDIAKALIKSKGDETKLFTFNVGTQF